VEATSEEMNEAREQVECNESSHIVLLLALSQLCSQWSESEER
jgi:hypothetical protein